MPSPDPVDPRVEYGPWRLVRDVMHHDRSGTRHTSQPEWRVDSMPDAELGEGDPRWDWWHRTTAVRNRARDALAASPERQEGKR